MTSEHPTPLPDRSSGLRCAGRPWSLLPHRGTSQLTEPGCLGRIPGLRLRQCFRDRRGSACHDPRRLPAARWRAILGRTLLRLGRGSCPTGRPGLRSQGSGGHTTALQLQGLALGHPFGERELAHRQRHSQLGRGRGGVRAVLRHPGLPGIELGHGWLSDHGLGHGPSSRQLGLGPRPELPGGGRVRTDDRHHPGLLTRKRAARKGRCRPERG